MSRVRQAGVTTVIEEAVAPAAVADEDQGRQEHQGTDSAGLSLQEKTEQVKPHEHGVAEPQGGVQGLRDQQNWQ